jgi:hypothetical protein
VSADEMTAWLRAQVEADKAAAGLAAREGSVWTEDDPLRRTGAISSLGGPVVYDEGAPDEHQAEHRVGDPRDAIADCDAKLAILDEHGPFDPASEWLSAFCRRCGDLDSNRVAVPCRTVRLLASGYRHRAGWQEGWQA